MEDFDVNEILDSGCDEEGEEDDENEDDENEDDTTDDSDNEDEDDDLEASASTFLSTIAAIAVLVATLIL